MVTYLSPVNVSMKDLLCPLLVGIMDLTYVAPAMNISMDFASMMIDTIPINKLAAIATTAIRAVRLSWALQMTIGIKRRMTRSKAMRTRVTRLRTEPDGMYTFGSLDTL